MTDLFDEIQEDFKAEKYNYIIRNVTRIFIVLVAITLVGVGIYVWKENASSKLQQQLSISFNKALLAVENNQLDKAIAHFDQVIEYSHQQYAALAYLNKAAILLKQQQYDQAQETLLEMAEHKHFDLALRELAQVTFLSNQFNLNQAPNDEMFERLSENDKPWQLLSLQLKALYQLKQANIEGAKASLKQAMGAPQASKASKDISSSILSSITRNQLGSK